MALFRAKARWLGGMRGPGWATPEYYGAKGSLATNDSAAFAAALADLGGVGKGARLILGPKQYRLDERLVMPSNVSLIGVPDVTYIASNHATEPGLVFPDYNEGPPLVIQDIRFIGLVANTGNCITNNGGARVQLVRCAWNGFNLGVASNNLRGKIASLNAAESELEFIDSTLGVVDAAVGVDILNGKVKITRGTLAMPASYGNALVNVGSSGQASLDGVTLDGSLTTVGTGHFVFAANGADVRMIGSRTLAGGTSSGKYMLGWDAGARVVEMGTVYDVMLKYSSTGQLATRSYLELIRSINASEASTAKTVPAGVRTFTVQCLAAGMTLTMPPILFVGQELDLVVFASGGTFGLSISGYGLKATQPTVTNNTGISARFVATDPTTSGTPSWVQIGDWASISA